MKQALFLFSLLVLFSYCVKPPSKSPVPELEYKNADIFPTTASGRDSANLIIGYEDGDGNLFVDDNSQGQNVIVSTYYYNADSSKFSFSKAIGTTVKQPDNGYYKGKSIRGEIIIPLREYRADKTKKIIRFDLFMIDRSNNKSNVVSSPGYTLNF